MYALTVHLGHAVNLSAPQISSVLYIGVSGHQLRSTSPLHAHGYFQQTDTLA